MNEEMMREVIRAAVSLVNHGDRQYASVQEADRFLKEMLAGYFFKKDDSTNPEKWVKL